LVDYRTWVRLNTQARAEWSEIFSDGRVPIQIIASQKARLASNADPESVFTIDWQVLTKVQQEAILEKLSQQSALSKEMLLKDILKVGLPLRRSLIVSCGINETEFYLW
jgi:hypothetical protein